MALRPRIGVRRALGLVMSCLVAFAGFACGALPFTTAPAASYTYGSQAPLRVAVADEAGSDWSASIDAAVGRYGAATSMLDFTSAAETANIVITIRSYTDDAPPTLPGYTFQPGVGGFAAVYDVDGRACNYPPSPLPLGCTGQIARADIYVSNALPQGADLAARRERLLVHELGHALGLTRHSPDLGIGQLEQRYGW